MHDTAETELCPKCDVTLRPGSQSKSTSGHFMINWGWMLTAVISRSSNTTFLLLSPSSLIVTIM